MSEMKPCPFCGSPASRFIRSPSVYWSIKCDNPECDAGWDNRFKTKEEATKRWNRRAEKTK